MFITKENRDRLADFYFHDLFVSDISYNVQENFYRVSFAYGADCSRSIGYASCHNVLCFKHSLLCPWSPGTGEALIVSCCSCFDDVQYIINQFDLPNRKYLTIDGKRIYKDIGDPIDISGYFLFSIMLSSGDTIEFLTDKIEVEGVDICSRL